jgi:prepilin-type N-terminal cleavage/methylation domain-containing protein
MKNDGFTLIEVMISVAIMLVAFTAIFSIQAGSMNALDRTKRMTIITMLARNAMIESELATQGKSFKEVNKEETGEFKPPFNEYKWKREIKEIKFPVLNFAAGGTGDGDEGGEKGESSNANNAIMEKMSKIFAKYLSDSVREIAVTITWPISKGTMSYTVSTYWVDLGAQVSLDE